MAGGLPGYSYNGLIMSEVAMYSKTRLAADQIEGQRSLTPRGRRIVYAIVAAAAGWTAWTLFLRGLLKRRAAAKGGPACGGDCACGD